MHWWQTAVLYQVYPRSFQDANGDGVGDLRGIIKRLPYLAELGVDALWLSPVFASPMADFGYDISDHTAIDPLFGTMADFDSLVAGAHKRGLKVLLDFVPNHTSIEHPWFKESRASRDNPRRDWYIWRDEPNNWLSEFGGSAWQRDEATGQFYYHAFLKEQPDLNWRNPQVRAAMHDVMRFWLTRGVDGFRVDVMWHLIKDEEFRDNPPNADFKPGDPAYRQFLPLYSTDRPEVHEIVRELRGLVDEFPERLLIGEIYLPLEKLVAYYGPELSGAQLPFNFSLLETPWRALEVGHLVALYESLLPEGAWPNWVLGNHDRPRVASRIGAAQARVAAMLLLTLRGTPTLYYGDEIGLPQVTIPPARVRDPWEKNVPGQGRDGCRTPMQWDASRFAGFSSAQPWLPLSEDAKTRHVAAQKRDPNSLLNLYRALIFLRRAHPALSAGNCRAVAADANVLTYVRQQGSERFLVALNFASEDVSVALPGPGTLMLSTDPARARGTIEGKIALSGDEGVAIQLG